MWNILHKPKRGEGIYLTKQQQQKQQQQQQQQDADTFQTYSSFPYFNSNTIRMKIFPFPWRQQNFFYFLAIVYSSARDVMSGDIIMYWKQNVDESNRKDYEVGNVPIRISEVKFEFIFKLAAKVHVNKLSSLEGNFLFVVNTRAEKHSVPYYLKSKN